MKLVLVSPWVTRQGGGVAEAVRLTAKLLAAEPGIEVEVLSVRDHGAHVALDDWGGARLEVCRYYGPQSYRFSPGLLLRLLRSDAELLHVHGLWSFQCLAVLLWSLLRRRPYIVSPHGMLEGYILRRSPRLKRLVQALYQRTLLRRAAAIQVLTEAERADVTPYADAGRIAIIPNFVEPGTAASRRPDWLDAGRATYLYFGRIHDKKGWRALCTAWDRACSGDAGFRATSQLAFCGWPDAVPNFDAVVGQLRTKHANVLTAGPHFGADKLATLAAADVLVLPSLSEGLPLVVLEAWAAGTPVLMTAACNLPLGFMRGAALEIGPDPEAIETGLLGFASLSPERRAAMGQAARQLVADEFSPEPIRRRLLEFYRRVIAEGAKP